MFNINKWDELIKNPGKIVTNVKKANIEDTHVFLDAFVEDGVPIALKTNNWGTITAHAIVTKEELDSMAEHCNHLPLDQNHGIIFPEVLIDDGEYYEAFIQGFKHALYYYSNIDIEKENIQFKGKYIIGFDFQHFKDEKDIKSPELIDKLWQVLEASKVPNLHYEIIERDRKEYQEWKSKQDPNKENDGSEKVHIIDEPYLTLWIGRLINALHYNKNKAA